MTPLVPVPYAVVTLAVALLFAGIFLAGGRVAYRPGQRGYRRFLSFAAGIAVGYTFVHVLPALGRLQSTQAEAGQSESPRLPHDWPYRGEAVDRGPAAARYTPIAVGHQASPGAEGLLGFLEALPEYSLYLWAMAGFLAFYGLEAMATGSRRSSAEGARHAGGPAPGLPWVHIGGFALYAWLLTYLLVWTGKGVAALCLYSVAMGLHLLPVAGGLSRHYPGAYEQRGALLLAAACLAGWACGLAWDVPQPALRPLIAVVAGGVIVNAMIAELPSEKEGRYGYFVAGAAAYTVLLLALSRVEEGA